MLLFIYHSCYLSNFQVWWTILKCLILLGKTTSFHNVYSIVDFSLKLSTSSVLFSSVTQSCLTHCDPMECSTPGFPVHHKLTDLAQTHVCQINDAIQPSHFYFIAFLKNICVGSPCTYLTVISLCISCTLHLLNVDFPRILLWNFFFWWMFTFHWMFLHIDLCLLLIFKLIF